MSKNCDQESIQVVSYNSQVFTLKSRAKMGRSVCRNDKTIVKLLAIAKNSKESEFQRNPLYVKFKLKKNINVNEIDLILYGLYPLEFHEESIYWNKRVLKENVGDKDQIYHFFDK